jgi:MFS superfamily sulfate permease-like transporter
MSQTRHTKFCAAQVSGIVSVITVVFLVLFVGPVLYYLPNCVLSSIIVVAVGSLIDTETATRLWSVDRRDLLTMAAAFIATLFSGVLNGVAISLGFSLLVFLEQTTQPIIEELGRLSGTVIYRFVAFPSCTCCCCVPLAAMGTIAL